VDAGVQVLVRRTVIAGRSFTLGEPGELLLP
jgi:hypothetical protein